MGKFIKADIGFRTIMATVRKEYELNRGWITDSDGETIGETNFVISANFLLSHWKECPNYNAEDDIEEFLATYVPEEDGQYLYEQAKATGNLVQDIGITEIDNNDYER